MARDNKTPREELVERLESAEVLSEGDSPFATPRWMMHRLSLSVGQRVKLLRRAMGLTEKDLGNRIGMRWAVQAWEGGKHDPSMEALKRLVWCFRQQWADFGLEDLTGPLGPDNWEE